MSGAGLRRRTVLTGALALAGAAATGARAAVETPALELAVGRGVLPPVASRLPAEPLVVDLAARGRETGAQGGEIRTLIGAARDVRIAVVYGYARLVGFDESYALVPDILRAVDVEDGRAFTFRLRRGHRWSDGHPFTTEDFRYWWEDVALNPQLSPAGPPEVMLVDGAPPEVTVLDEATLRYVWPRPNPRFLPALAAARPLDVMSPSHVVRQFHERYADPAALAAAVAADSARSWAALHNKRDDLYAFDNPATPTLQPWMNVTPKNAQRYVLERNPFYHRVDAQGRQLPYVDKVEMLVASGGLIPAKTNRGEVELQARGLSFSDAPVLRKGEKTGGYETRLWRSGYASEIALYPNLNVNDPVWRGLMRDVRFRRALSVAISRETIDRSLFFGLGRPAAMAALPESPFYDETHASSWAQFDPGLAAALLDEIGLTGRRAGVRLLPDGRQLEIVSETAGERREEIDALELIAEMWAEVGVRLIFRPLDRDILRNRVFAGESMMPVWFGWNLGIPTADAVPNEVAPVDQAVFSWPKWGQHVQSGGKLGEAVDLPEAQRLLALFEIWSRAADAAGRASAWREMLAIHADQVYAIGLVASAPQPVVVSKRLRNLPQTAAFAWDPGAHFGVHRIDEAFLAS
jgi:peptide/nickel transport system substrate-binding protein